MKTYEHRRVLTNIEEHLKLEGRKRDYTTTIVNTEMKIHTHSEKVNSYRVISPWRAQA